ncbi:MAG: DNA-directed RNA polymerase subunit beta [Chrysiogenetes bacterium]|nr:DNA-directed RNA polymerase subunit beta [Chrysiogenetes bacterium]
MSVSRIETAQLRRSYARIPRIIDVPNLIEVQKRSYDKFLQAGVAPEDRDDSGLQAVFKSVFPIRDFNKTASLEFVSYRLEEPKYDVDECHQRGMTYAAPLQVTVRLVVWDTNEETGAQTIRDVKEQEVYFGEIPLMTEHGTFIVNGTERVIVSQLHRSPGVFFDHDKGKHYSSGRLIYSARIIPYRGSWLDFEFDPKDLLHVRIDRRRKLPVSVLLKALGMNDEEILTEYYKTELVTYEGKKWFRKFEPELMLGQRAPRDIRDPETREVLIKKNRKINNRAIEKLHEAKITRLPFEDDELLGKVVAHDIVNPNTGEVIAECNQEVTEEILEQVRETKLESFEILYMDGHVHHSSLRDTLLVDKTITQEEALVEIYRRLRPGDPPMLETAKNLFESLFFNPERYDLSRVGRVKMNIKLGLEASVEQVTLDHRDIKEVIRYLLALKGGQGSIDDIDHLGNRRVRSVGELLENQYRIGLVRMERAIKERMSFHEVETLMPHDLINAKPVSAVVKEFFGSSQLSQFMDQTNPLSEVTHKRRLSALGPGGLTRERAGFEVRDVHPTHYGRICPVETPEGPNIGLIASLSTYARINDYGFIETPYRKVENGRVTGEVAYLSALEEEGHTIAQATHELGPDGAFVTETVQARRAGEFAFVPPEEVDLMDVGANQLVSVAAALIPFLENDDANRALMGSNMQRQAVPLLRTEAPLVGTGMEGTVARDSGVAISAKRDGIVEYVDANRIVVRATAEIAPFNDVGIDIYRMLKYQRSNQNTCLNQKPIVQIGEVVRKGQVLADGPATANGELALGQNLLVAFMPWGGYNFEDSILMSERVVAGDRYTSVHIEEFEAVARDTKLGPEEITRDIPNVGEEALADLDESGIVRIGAEVQAGSILVGKITPKGETQLSPEEKLLRAIFGEKAGDVRDTSLRVPPGVTGTVIDARVFTRKGVDKDQRLQEIEEAEVEKLELDKADEIRIIRRTANDKIYDLLKDKQVAENAYDADGNMVCKKGETLTAEVLEKLPGSKYRDIVLKDEEVNNQIRRSLDTVEERIALVKRHTDEKISRLKKGDELPPGVIKMVKVFVAIKRKLQVGDKMAGRHGNKGVVSRILPEEDMPYLEDGTPVEIVLNPLGVPSRMNVGQILETHIGWAARGMGAKIQKICDEYREKAAAELRTFFKDVYGKDYEKIFKGFDDDAVIDAAKKLSKGLHLGTPVFDGAHEPDITELMAKAGFDDTGQSRLIDGRTGEMFENPVTVGVMYVLKLHHLVDDKIHARSIGPYSLVTQQPLGGKAQFGGQRLGEMEVWALEAYGASFALQEFLTVKSDDIKGRNRMYEAIVKGEQVFEPGLPESFNVLVKELQSLALDVTLLEDDQPIPTTGS